MNNLYICPTFHPAGNKSLESLSKDYQIAFYNFSKNERTKLEPPNCKFIDFKLTKIKSRKLDFAFTNTLPIAAYILRHRPASVVTEDYVFALPYLILCRFLKIKVTFYNSNTSPIASRANSRLVKFFKQKILCLFEDFWHGFEGGEKFVEQYLNVESRLVPWVRLNRREIIFPSEDILTGIFVGEFTDRKRISYVIEQVKHAESELVDRFDIDLIGAKDDSPFYKERYKAVPHSEAIQRIAKSNLLILLSSREATGSVVLEALQCGLFVVLSKEVGANELIKKEKSGKVSDRGILYNNKLGCIIDTEQISPKNLNEFLVKNKENIINNRLYRQESVSEYFV